MDIISFEDFYKDAMDFFIEAGHAASSIPLYINHSVKQVIYFDTKKTLLIDNDQKLDLDIAANISHLFDIGDDLFTAKSGNKVSYYSIVIECGKTNRSQAAYITHTLLHPAFEADVSIVLFRHSDEIMLSVLGSDTDLVLSDWYNIDTNCDSFIERIHIANLSLSSASEFVADLDYCVARDYYLQPPADYNDIYSLLPTYFFGAPNISDIATIDKETIVETIHEILTSSEKAYGDDYVETSSHSVEVMRDIGIELEVLSFELESEEEAMSDEILNDDEDVRNVVFGEIEDVEEVAKDEYEFDNVDPEVFKNANLLIEWLRKNEVTIRGEHSRI